ncbi:unnamed protein product [Spirodela intermedia]|uniref:Uncharacterized protein n=1 Tax=Spirodela intermedia TaxID=51605 RepID=A0A7I8JEI9_SPIIN|nr:unnamed protein product [Spirodela intermedia]CAA6668537.1 unnamed protein product [Spirodela intermedia]
MYVGREWLASYKGGDPRSLLVLSPPEGGGRDELAHLWCAVGGAKGERRSRPSPR